MARPTHGKCDGFGGIHIKKGEYGTLKLNGLNFAFIASYPGPIHEGRGRASYYVDELADNDQFDALSQILMGKAGGRAFEIYASTCESFQAPKRAKIVFNLDGVKSSIRVENMAEVKLAPIKNPVTGEAHRAFIELPTGFEANRMDQASSEKLVVDDGYLHFKYSNTYGSISETSWKGP